MQDFRSFDDGNGGIFIGGDRRMRPNNNNNYQNQVIKCPRCDSINTKFCYYNNYNLSQPRHYCKSCRRYWTKGGVLRNVPVGGGCRKTKRSRPKPSAAETAPADSATDSVEIYSKSNCSSESSSLTATPTTQIPAASGSVVTDSSHFTMTSSILPESRFSVTPQTVKAAVTESNDSAAVNNFNSSNSFSSYRFNTTNNNQHQQLREDQQQWQLHDDKIMARNKVNDEPEVDWQINGTCGGSCDNEESLLTHQFTAGAVDQSYWSHNQWSDHDHSLY